MWCKHVVILCLEKTLTQSILKEMVSDSFFCLCVCSGWEQVNSSQLKMVRVCEDQQTAGRLLVQISFPLASLLIKQLNGQRKVVLRVKSVREKDTYTVHTHAHTHSACT